jgi:hypothetical protein
MEHVAPSSATWWTGYFFVPWHSCGKLPMKYEVESYQVIACFWTGC